MNGTTSEPCVHIGRALPAALGGAPGASGSVWPPTLSVVICTRDRPRALEACIRSVAAQRTPPREVIVVDDGELSQADRRMLTDICESVGIPFVYLRKGPGQRRPCLPASRNLAVPHARGDIIQFLDDDVTMEPEFCGQIQRLYADDPASLLLGTDGSLLEPSRTNLGARAFTVLFRAAGWWALRPRRRGLPLPACLRDSRRATPTLEIVGATMAFRRSALQHVPFDESLGDYALGEDRDMAYRLSRLGWIARCHTARATHHLDSTHRPDPYRLGCMTVQNYCRIMSNNGLNRFGDRLVIAYSLLVIGLGLLCFSVIRPRRYLPRVAGMIAAAASLHRG